MSDRYFSNSSKTGLETIDVPAGHDQSPREPERAKQLSGGIITGKAFQTDAVDPRIVIDSTGLIAHDSSGNQTIKIDVTTGNIDVLFGSGVTGGLRWVDGTGALQGLIVYDTVSIAVPTFMLEGKTRVLMGAFDTLPFSAGVTRQAYLYLDSSSGANSAITLIYFDGASTRAGSISIFPDYTVAPGTGNINLNVTDASNRNAQMFINTQVGANSGFQLNGTTDNWFVFCAASGQAVNIKNGTIITSTNTVEKHVLCAEPAFTASAGSKHKAVAAADGFGIIFQYRQVRGTAAGATATPGGATLTTTVLNSNVNTIAIDSIRPESARMTYSAVAAGAATIHVIWTFS